MSDMEQLLAVMVKLRHPQEGCPWDRDQSFETIAPHTIEEAYEVADAIERRDTQGLADELGDLLFQVVFHAELAKEQGLFRFEDVVQRIVDKLVRRHPHVFAGTHIESSEEQSLAWEAHKVRERAARQDDAMPSLMDHVTVGLPAILRAAKLQQRAATVAFDWVDALQVLEKITEEVDETERAIRSGGTQGAVIREIGDVIFTCVNLARHLRVDAETALRGANRRFEERFRRMEVLAAESGQTLSDLSLTQMNRLWQQAKTEGL
jgi:ATP diphosphatase